MDLSTTLSLLSIIYEDFLSHKSWFSTENMKQKNENSRPIIADCGSGQCFFRLLATVLGFGSYGYDVESS